MTQFLVAALLLASLVVSCGGANDGPRPKGAANEHDQCRAEIYSDYIGQYLTVRHVNDIRPKTIAGRDRYFDYRGRPDDRIIVVDFKGISGLNDALGAQIIDIYCGAH